MNSQDKQSNVKGKIRLFVVGCTCEYGDIDSSNEMVSMTFLWILDVLVPFLPTWVRRNNIGIERLSFQYKEIIFRTCLVLNIEDRIIATMINYGYS